MPGARPDNFTCAATLVAYAQAVRDGDVPHDNEMTPAAYMAVMWHMNAWAMPQDLSEPEAFAQVNAEAEHIREGTSANEITETARWCIDNKPSF